MDISSLQRKHSASVPFSECSTQVIDAIWKDRFFLTIIINRQFPHPKHTDQKRNETFRNFFFLIHAAREKRALLDIFDLAWRERGDTDTRRSASCISFRIIHLPELPSIIKCKAEVGDHLVFHVRMCMNDVSNDDC